MLTATERDVLNHALEKYRSGQSAPILIEGENVLKPALGLMSDYRLPEGAGCCDTRRSTKRPKSTLKSRRWSERHIDE
jgi:hypothetical protein